jgi:hypothetical protein
MSNLSIKLQHSRSPKFTLASALLFKVSYKTPRRFTRHFSAEHTRWLHVLLSTSTYSHPWCVTNACVAMYSTWNMELHTPLAIWVMIVYRDVYQCAWGPSEFRNNILQRSSVCDTRSSHGVFAPRRLLHLYYFNEILYNMICIMYENFSKLFILDVFKCIFNLGFLYACKIDDSGRYHS